MEWMQAFYQRIEPDATEPMLEHRLALISGCEDRAFRGIINPQKPYTDGSFFLP